MVGYSQSKVPRRGFSKLPGRTDILLLRQVNILYRLLSIIFILEVDFPSSSYLSIAYILSTVLYKTLQIFLAVARDALMPLYPSHALFPHIQLSSHTNCDYFFETIPGALTYYHDQSDMFDEHKDCKGEIALVNVLVVETPTDPKYKGAGYFDMHARVIEGGDANGMRVFSFNAQTPENAEKWMRELCRATEILELKHVGSNGFTSCVCEKMIMARNVKRMSVNTSAHNSSQTMIIQSNKWSEQDDDATSTVDSNDDGSSTLTKSERERERATNGMENGPGGHGGGRGGKRGGMGRGVFFKAGTGSQGYSRAANDTLGSIEENKEEMLGGSYDQLYGDGEL